MAESDAVVYVADNPKVAEAVIQLFASRDIPAEIVGSGPQTSSEPITGMTEMTSSEEFTIRVTNPAKIAEAKELIASAATAAAVHAVREKRANRTGTVTAVCEDCGKPSQWPAEMMGTTETCPHCGAYLDVPDPDDDWSGVDFGDENEEDNKEKSQK